MYKLPSIDNETELVKKMLTDDREGPEIAKDYGIGTKLLNERMRHQRSFYLDLDSMSNEDVISAINQIGGSIYKQARWFKSSATNFINSVFNKLMDDETFIKYYTSDNGLSYTEYSNKIGLPNFLTHNTVKRRAHKLNIKRSKVYNYNRLNKAYYSNEEKLRNAQKIRESTMIERYGSRTPLQNRNILKKTINTVKDKYGVSTYLLSKEFKDKMPTFHPSTHNEENIVINKIIDMLGDNHTYNITNKYKFLDYQELDLLIDDKYAIEFNGIYWHSTKQGNRDKNYHINKYLKCKDNSITLLSIWENDWRINSNPILESINRIISNEVDYVNVLDTTLLKTTLTDKELIKLYTKVNYSSCITYSINYKDTIIGYIAVNDNTIIDISMLGKYKLSGDAVYLLDNLNCNLLYIDNDLGNDSGISLDSLIYVGINNNLITNYKDSGYDIYPTGLNVYKKALK